MTLAYRTVIDKFAQLSDGDRSCVLAMLRSPPADQMTSKGSAHDQFYLALERLVPRHRGFDGLDVGLQDG